MRLLIEILAAILLVCCVSPSPAQPAAGKMGRGADGVSCGVSVPANASPAARCAAIQPAMRREVLRQLLRQVPAVGGELGAGAAAYRCRPGERRDP